jgi:nucleoside-diphosphate-sugar epimerase
MNAWPVFSHVDCAFQARLEQWPHRHPPEPLMTSTVLILGAAGRLGQVLASAFADAGWRVRAQARKPLPAVLAGHPRVQPIRCDATDVAALTQAAHGVTVIVNALNPPYTEWERLALPLADAALAVARASGALLMLPGNVYNYGREMPPLLTPATPEAATRRRRASASRSKPGWPRRRSRASTAR